MKKSKIKFIVRKSMQEYYKNGLTNTAYRVREKINDAIDKLYEKNHKKK